MFSHSKRLDALRARIDAPDGIGRLRRITSHFTFSGDAAFQRGNIRVNSELEPAGCLGDLGWYNLRLILWVMGFRAPESVVAHTLTPLRGDSSPAAVPGEFSAELFFPGGVTASMYCSFLTENLQVSVIAGDRGYITLDDFVLPFFGAELDWHESQHFLEIDNCRWNMRRHTRRGAVTEYAGGEPDAQEVRMIVAMNRLVLDGVLDPHWPKIAMLTQRVMDACRASADADGKRVRLGD
jgi:predicted dehydrogenase